MLHYDYLRWDHLHVPGKAGGRCAQLPATNTVEQTHVNSHFHEQDKHSLDNKHIFTDLTQSVKIN